MDFVDPWLNHIKYVFCDGNQEHYEFSMSWLAHMLQKPDEKCPVSIVIRSTREGTGKNTLTDFFTDFILGMSNSVYANSLDQLKEKN